VTPRQLSETEAERVIHNTLAKRMTERKGRRMNGEILTNEHGRRHDNPRLAMRTLRLHGRS
jgi:hypothetical protein